MFSGLVNLVVHAAIPPVGIGKQVGLETGVIECSIENFGILLTSGFYFNGIKLCFP